MKVHFNESAFNETAFNDSGSSEISFAGIDPGVSFTISDELGGGGDDEE